jgi:hypothetical protein
MRTRPLLICEDLNINEKLIFNDFLISHVPRETRADINILGFNQDLDLKNKIRMGYTSTPLFDDNGFLIRGVIPLYIWPLFHSDPRIVGASPFHGKYHDEAKTCFDDKNYCRLFIEFPKFIKPFVYMLKSPQSYMDFQAIKYPHTKPSKTLEVKEVYADALEQLEELIDNLQNKDEYFVKMSQVKGDRDKLNSPFADESDETDSLKEDKKM